MPRTAVQTRAVSVDPQQMQAHACEAAQLLRALANEQRLLILCQLVGGEHSVGELHARLQLSQSALSQHLARLREAELVVTRRQGQSIYYSLSEGPVTSLMHTLHEIYCAPSPRAAAGAGR